MPVYETTYKSWEGEKEPMINRLLTFSKYTLLQMSGRKKMHMVFIFSWFPFILFLLYIYARVNVNLLKTINIPLGNLPPVNMKFFVTYLTVQLPFIFFFTLTVGPHLISPDIKNKALPMILSKPINGWEYVLGKFLVLFILLSALTWVQTSIIYISNLAAVPAADEWRTSFFTVAVPIFFNTLLFALLIIISMDLIVLMFSSITNTPSFAGAAFIMFTIGGLILSQVLNGIFNTESWSYVSIFRSVIRIGENYVNDGGEKIVFKPMLSILIHWAFCLYIIKNKVKAFTIYRE